MAKSTRVTRTMSPKEARKEIKRLKKLSRRGPLAPYRMMVAVLLGLLVGGAEIWANLQGDPTMGVVRFAAGALLGWVMWGVIDSAFAAANREMEAAERRARRERRQAEREARNMGTES